MATEPYTQTPNAIYDAMPDMLDAELRVSMAVVRKTAGWRKASEVISYSEFQEITGLSRQSVKNGIEAALKRGLITRTPEGGQQFRYQIVNQSRNQTSLKNRPVQEVDQTSLPSRPEPVQEVDQSPDSIKETEKKQPERKGDRTPPPARLPIPPELGGKGRQPHPQQRAPLEIVKAAHALGLDPPQFRELTDLLLEMTGKTALAASRAGDGILREAQEAVLALTEMGQGNPEEFRRIAQSFRAAHPRHTTPPTFGQLLSHASELRAGKVFTPQPAFGLQRNGTHYATAVHPSTRPTDEEQPSAEWIARIKAANRAIDEAAGITR